jgi:hypothetical protein
MGVQAGRPTSGLGTGEEDSLISAGSPITFAVNQCAGDVGYPMLVPEPIAHPCKRARMSHLSATDWLSTPSSVSAQRRCRTATARQAGSLEQRRTGGPNV